MKLQGRAKIQGRALGWLHGEGSMLGARIEDRARIAVLVHINLDPCLTTQGLMQPGIESGRICLLDVHGMSRGDEQDKCSADHDDERLPHHDIDILLRIRGLG